MSTTTTAPPHVLVVTRVPCPECPADGPCEECAEEPETAYAIECPGVRVGRCNSWKECAECKAAGRMPWSDYEEDDLTAHGAVHLVFDGIFCTETEQCYVQWCDTSDTAWDVSSDKPGRYPVDWECGDPGECFLTLLAA